MSPRAVGGARRGTSVRISPPSVFPSLCTRVRGRARTYVDRWDSSTFGFRVVPQIESTRCPCRELASGRTSCPRRRASSPHALVSWIPAFAGMTQGHKSWQGIYETDIYLESNHTLIGSKTVRHHSDWFFLFEISPQLAYFSNTSSPWSNSHAVWLRRRRQCAALS